jgi:predicted Zn-ribbon and HTH transcriptional regulator
MASHLNETRWVFWTPPKDPETYNTDGDRVRSFVLGRLLVRYDPVDTMSLKTLKRTAGELHLDIGDCIEKGEIRKRVKTRRNDRCPICLDDFEDSEQVAQTVCGHAFCAPCLVKATETALEDREIERVYWMDRGVVLDEVSKYPPCPVCKSPIDRAGA